MKAETASITLDRDGQVFLNREPVTVSRARRAPAPAAGQEPRSRRRDQRRPRGARTRVWWMRSTRSDRPARRVAIAVVPDGARGR